MKVLDSDHVSILARDDTEVSDRLWQRLRQLPDEEFVVTAVTLEEQTRGWLAAIRKQKDVTQQVRFYDRLIELFRFYRNWRIIRFDDPAAAEFKRLRQERVRIGTQDLKIASICLIHDATLLSSNLRDFELVPDLRVEDWVHG